MSKPYTQAQMALQHQFGVEALAKRMTEVVIRSEFSDDDKAFIESRDCFFLASVDASGQPTCSYKGGHPGFVRLTGSTTLAFPLYNGNSMFLSAGNMSETGKIGMLFIDFETPHRLRVEGTVRLTSDSDTCIQWPGAELVAWLELSAVFVNCPRYVHRSDRVAQSPYVPVDGVEPPLPAWKRLESFQDAMPHADQQRVAQAGGTITVEEYRAKRAAGDA